MSIQAVATVLETDVGEVAAKMLLICLANAHNTSTGLCCPTIERLAKESGMGRSTVKRWVRWLEANRYVQVIPTHSDSGRQQSHQYRLTLGEGSNLGPSEGSKSDPVQSGLEPTTEPLGGSACEPPLKKPEEIPIPPKAPLPLYDEFEAVVEAWPKLTDNHRNEAWAEYGKLTVDEKAKCITAGRKYPAQCRADAAKRGREMFEHLPYTKALPNWIRERKWEGATPAPSTKGMRWLDRVSPLFEECESIEGTKFGTSGSYFKIGTVERAEASMQHG